MENVEKFKNDPFLSQALIGDYVLFYPYQGRTVKAILWRPSIDKIIDAALVIIPDNIPDTSEATAPAP